MTSERKIVHSVKEDATFRNFLVLQQQPQNDWAAPNRQPQEFSIIKHAGIDRVAAACRE